MKNKSILSILITALICVLVAVGISFGTTTKKVEARKVQPRKTEAKADNSKKANDSASNGEADGYKDGNWEGTGNGYKGEVKVRVTVKDGKITAVDILSNVDDAAYFNNAKGVISSVIEQQTPNVDTVSGATFSSVGILDAIYNALENGGN